MFLDLLNPNLPSVFRFEASVTSYADFYYENVDFQTLFILVLMPFLYVSRLVSTDLTFIFHDETFFYQDMRLLPWRLLPSSDKILTLEGRQ